MHNDMHDRATKRAFSMFLGIAFLVTASSVTKGANISWTGAGGDGSYTNAANWTPRRPNNNDYEDTVVFGSLGTPATIVLAKLPGPAWDPTLQVPSHLGVRFDTVPWTLSDSGGVAYNEITTLSSSGGGTNTIASSLNVHNPATWTVGSGNVLYLTKGFYEKDKNINLQGGGTLRVGVSIGGYGSGTWGIHIRDAVLRIDAAAPYSSGGGAIYLSRSAAKFQLKTTVAAAKALIGTRIRDEVGTGLKVTDIGGGYVEVTVAPRATLITLR